METDAKFDSTRLLKNILMYYVCINDLTIFVRIILSIKVLTNPFFGAGSGGAGVEGGAPPPDILKTAKEK